MIGRSLIGSAFLIVLAVGACQADLLCPHPTHDAGEIHGGKTVKQAFTLKNRSGEVIRMMEIKPGCGCLRPHLDRPSLRPGEEATVTMEINTLTQPEGANRWGATMRYTVGGQVREEFLSVTGRVVPELHITPATMILYTEGTASHHFTLIERRPTPLVIHKAISYSPHIRTRVGGVRKENGHWVRQIHLNVTSTCPEGRHEDVLHLFTEDPDYPELKTPFSVVKRIRGKVAASPSLVDLTLGENGPLPARIVLLGTFDEEKVKIEKVETTHAFIRCTHAEGPGPRSTLRVLVDREQIGKEGVNGEVRVHLSQPMGQVVTIPVQVR